MTLTDAVSMIKKIASYGNTHTNAAVASFLGHSTSNSGPYRSKIAALKDYGLLSGRGDELTVTPLALEITHPGLDADIQASMRAAFLKCSLFQTVYNSLPKDTKLQVGALANSAMHNHGVAAQAKDAFASAFVKSGVTAGLIEEVDSDHVQLSDGLPAEQSDFAEVFEDEDVAQGASTLSPAAAVSNTWTSPPSANAVVSHAWPITGGVVRFIIESSTPLPAAAYSVIGTVITEGDKLAAMLGDAEVADAVGGDTD
ncbi:hypothetical protein JVX93_09635 [Mycolicibacterium boenickei]|nr:hypothetical protein JVX93_09635 [Mycolicibacterium boenickei]